MISISNISTTISAFTKKNYSAILNQAAVDEKWLNYTNHSLYLRLKNTWNLEGGLYSPAQFGYGSSCLTSDTSNFPVCPIVPVETKYTLETSISELEELKNHSSTDETRLNICTVALNRGMLVATDGHTLKFRKLEPSSDELTAHLKLSFLMDARDIAHFCKIAKKLGVKKDEKISIEIKDGWAVFKNESFEAYFKEVPKEYPNIKTFIGNFKSAHFELKNLPSVKEMKSFETDFICGKKFLVCRIFNEGNNVFLEIEDFKKKIGLTLKDNIQIDFHANYTYLKDIMGKRKGSVYFQFQSNERPIYFLIEGNPLIEGVLMPFRPKPKAEVA